MTFHPVDHDPYEMLYCDTASCRVNEFECGSTGRCPGCGEIGEVIH